MHAIFLKKQFRYDELSFVQFDFLAALNVNL